MSLLTFAYVPSSHLDLFWLGSYRTCLARGAHVIKTYLDRCLATPDETFLLETTVFAGYFLRKHPEYRQPLLDLIAAGRVEVGTVYVDRWEHLVPGESHIRNIQFGARWSIEHLGFQNRLATHPDLPGLIPQTSQIYAQAGVDYYVTSRKLFEDGAVWRHRSPDGTSLIYLNWPKHYMYFPLAATDLARESAGWGPVALDADASHKGFPLGVIPVNGSAADLTDPETFKERYGDYLWNLVAANRDAYPQYEFTYTVPSTVLEPYRELETLPVLEGEVPSVWGVACDEEVKFFQRNRLAEQQLLAAETLVVVLDSLGIAWRPETAATWQGTFYESAFYETKDPIAEGAELTELWRMQLFSADHNGGGYEGALSTFQKRVMQQRILQYTGEILATGLKGIASRFSSPASGSLLFNSQGAAWSGPVRLSVPTAAWNAGLRPLGPNGTLLLSQIDPSAEAPDGYMSVAVEMNDVPPVGYRLVPFADAGADISEEASSCTVTRADGRLQASTSGIVLEVDTVTGEIVRLQDRQRKTDWARRAFGGVRALRETGNDVTLRMDADAEPVTASLVDVEVVESGPVFTRIRICRSLLNAAVSQNITLWSKKERIDFDTTINWWGAHNWQIRLALPSVPDRASISYGTPFFGSGWDAVAAGASPRNPDEILVEDYPRYREVQQWLHLRDGDAGLGIVTHHPGFVHDDNGLEAVLMRTSPSCGDARYFWENAGEQVYRFSLVATASDWQEEGFIRTAVHILRPPATLWVESTGHGDLAPPASFFEVESESAILSSLAPNADRHGFFARVYESGGKISQVAITGSLAEADETTVELVDLLDRPQDALVNGGRGRQFQLTPWRIQTIRFDNA